MSFHLIPFDIHPFLLYQAHCCRGRNARQRPIESWCLLFAAAGQNPGEARGRLASRFERAVFVFEKMRRFAMSGHWRIHLCFVPSCLPPWDQVLILCYVAPCLGWLVKIKNKKCHCTRLASDEPSERGPRPLRLAGLVLRQFPYLPSYHAPQY